jgi:hypothetical protein
MKIGMSKLDNKIAQAQKILSSLITLDIHNYGFTIKQKPKHYFIYKP